MASGHVNRAKRPNTWQHRPKPAYVKKALANPEPSTHGTISVEASRGFSAYRWIRNELVRLGVPASEIAYMQDHQKSEAKQRLFNDFNAGKVRFIIGSSDTMGTGVNVQLRLKALHHLDVPWLPSQIEQREGRIVRQATSTTRSTSSPMRRSAPSTPRCGRTTSARPASSRRRSRATPAFVGSRTSARVRRTSLPWRKQSRPAIRA